jgi:putative oxidoreductase
MTEIGTDGQETSFWRRGWRWKTEPHGETADVGLLLLRVVTGLLMMTRHGWGKLTSFGERAAIWADPIGVGSELSLALAIFAEFFCSALVVVGLATRGAAIPVVCTMFVAAGIVHWDDPFGKKEFPLLFLTPFLTLVCTGAGRYSIDGWLQNRRNKDSHE